MEKKGKIIGVCAGLVCLVIILGVIFQSPSIMGNAIKEYEEININYDNFAEVLSNNQIVEDLPKNTVVLLSEYGGNESHEYLIERGKISEYDAEDVDFEVSIHSKYLEGLTNYNYCDVLSKAIDNGDYKLYLKMSKIGLVWKYKRMIKYKGCFGV